MKKLGRRRLDRFLFYVVPLLLLGIFLYFAGAISIIAELFFGIAIVMVVWYLVYRILTG